MIKRILKCILFLSIFLLPAVGLIIVTELEQKDLTNSYLHLVNKYNKEFEYNGMYNDDYYLVIQYTTDCEEHGKDNIKVFIKDGEIKDNYEEHK